MYSNRSAMAYHATQYVPKNTSWRFLIIPFSPILFVHSRATTFKTKHPPSAIPSKKSAKIDTISRNEKAAFRFRKSGGFSRDLWPDARRRSEQCRQRGVGNFTGLNSPRHLDSGWCLGWESWVSLTSWKTNMSPENQWLEDVFPIEIIHFGGIC